MDGRIRVLHVDDDPDLADVTATVLERADERFVVETATDATEGLDRLSGGGFDCVVSDYDMPDRDGVEFLEAVREEYPDLPFILYTGKGSEVVASEAISAGVTDYLQKDSSTEQYELLANRIENATAQFRTQRQLRAERAFTEQALDALGDLFYVIDPDGTLRRWNERVPEVTGYTDAELDEIDAIELFPEDERERAADAITETLSTGEATAEIDVHTKDGDRIPYEFTGSRLTDAEGNLLGLVGIGRDLSTRRERERRLRTRRRQLERLHESTRELMAAETRAEVADRASETTREVLDLPLNGIHFYDPEQHALVPVTVTDRVHEVLGEPPDIGPGDGIAWTAYETGETRVHADVREAPDVMNPDTSIRSELHLPLGEHGVLVVASTVVDDFTDADVTLAKILAANVEAALDRAERERDLRGQRRAFERQNERLDEFAGVVSHDLRNPLNVAQGRLDLAREGREGDHLDVVDEALDRMEELIDRTLTLARSGRVVSETEPVDLSMLARRCWDTVDTGNAALRVENAPEVRADPDRLRHLFENLYRNSVEHSSTGSRPEAGDSVEHGSTGNRTKSDDSVEYSGPDVTVRVGACNDRAGFYVSDDGPGIPAGEREQVFETGYSSDADGTGLGLSIVRQIAEAHGWEIGVTDSAAGGARFEVTGVEFL